MTMTPHRRNILIAALAGVAVAALVTVLIVGYGRTPAAETVAAAAPDPNALNIPTIEQMCASAGQGAGEALKQCQAEQSGASEYVIAWMGLNGFMAGGAIDFAAIQFGASLDGDDPLTISESDPLAGATDPVTGEPLGQGQPAATIALMCLGSSPDWLTMQACISQSDPGASLENALGGDLGPNPADPAAGGAP